MRFRKGVFEMKFCGVKLIPALPDMNRYFTFDMDRVSGEAKAKVMKAKCEAKGIEFLYIGQYCTNDGLVYKHKIMMVTKSILKQK
jgi:hypothetical protein